MFYFSNTKRTEHFQHHNISSSQKIIVTSSVCKPSRVYCAYIRDKISHCTSYTEISCCNVYFRVLPNAIFDWILYHTRYIYRDTVQYVHSGAALGQIWYQTSWYTVHKETLFLRALPYVPSNCTSRQNLVDKRRTRKPTFQCDFACAYSNLPAF